MTVAMQPDPCDETETWVNRNGTFLRVLIVVDEHSDLPRYFGEVDVSIQRLVVIAACGADQLNASTERLSLAAAAQGIELVPAHGHHRCLLDRIAAANDVRYQP
jgi:hypothetical protein